MSLKSLWERFIQNRPVYQKLAAKYERATTDLTDVRHKHEGTTAKLDEVQHTLDKLEKDHEQTTRALTEEREKHAEKTADFNVLREEHGQTKTDLTKARANFNELDQKYNLVSDLLTSKSSENEALEKFKELLNGQFKDFANEESSLAEEEEAVRRLRSVEKRLEKIVALPHTFMKKSIAIGGGFSSGKSEFVNSFITEPDVKMPVDINPATAIPSFVISSSEVSIKGFSRDGATVDIKPAFYRKLSREFVDTFSFRLKDLMPSITVEVPLREGLFENIYLIDTPGYDSAGGNTGEDRETAAEVLKNRDALIWMISVFDGTIQKDDLDFIKGLKLNGLPFYVVLNKADRKPESELEDILDQVKETLEDVSEDVGIELVGISAYSARRRKEYLFDEDGVSLHDFFRNQNQPKGEIETELRGEIESVFAMYEDAIRKDEHTATVLKSELNSLGLDLNNFSHQIDPGEHDVLSEKINNIKKSQAKDFTSIKAKREEIEKDMLEAFDEVCRSLLPEGSEAMPRPSSAPAPKPEQGSPSPSTQGSAVKRRGYIKGGKYIKTAAEQPEQPSAPALTKRQIEQATLRFINSESANSLADRLGIRADVAKNIVDDRTQKGPFQRLDELKRVRGIGPYIFEQLIERLQAAHPILSVYQAHGESKISDEQAPPSATKQIEQATLRFINKATANSLADGRLGFPYHVAENIVAYRHWKGGPFRHLDELKQVHGIGPYIFEQLIERLQAAHPILSVYQAHGESKISDEQAPQSATEQIEQSALGYINSESANSLADRLGIRAYVAKNIVGYRTQNGTFQRLDELKRVPGIGSSTFEQLIERLRDIRHIF